MNNYYKHILYKVFFYILFGIVIFSLSHIFYGYESVNALTDQTTLIAPTGFSNVPTSSQTCNAGNGDYIFLTGNESFNNNPFRSHNVSIGSVPGFFNGGRSFSSCSSPMSYLKSDDVRDNVISLSSNSLSNLNGVKTIYFSFYTDESRIFHNWYYVYYTDIENNKYKCDVNNSVTYYDEDNQKFGYGMSVFCNIDFTNKENLLINDYLYFSIYGQSITNAFNTNGFLFSNFYYIDDTTGEYAPLYSNSIITDDEYNELTQTNEKLDNINNSINDSNVGGAITDSNSLIGNNNFNKNYGLQDIVNAPVNLINRLSSTCSPINLTIPYFNANVSIPCMSTIYPKIIGTAGVNTISVVINGIFAYRMLLVLFHFVNKTQKSDNDEVEVIKL